MQLLYKCLACGHEFEGRLESPKRRQCSKCGRRRAIEAYRYGKAIDAAKDFRRRFPSSSFEEAIDAIDSLRSVLDTASPVASLVSALAGELGDAVLDPFIAIRVTWDIWRQAGQELKDEKQDQEDTQAKINHAKGAGDFGRRK